MEQLTITGLEALRKEKHHCRWGGETSCAQEHSQVLGEDHTWRIPHNCPSPGWLTGPQTPSTVQGSCPTGSLQPDIQFRWLRAFARVDVGCSEPVCFHAKFAPWHEPFQETPGEWQSCEPFLQCWREQCGTPRVSTGEFSGCRVFYILGITESQ